MRIVGDREKMRKEILDVAEDYQLGFQDPATPIMESIINFHNYTMTYLIFIVIGVTYMLGRIIVEYGKTNRVIAHKYLIHGTEIELV